ncbi:hypothetical protein M3M35_03780 [Fructilactobacillus myrtifloralis]|uniref:Integral membrane protein n=1 Tax=Fructilactobacillus myrtifloralis TaxID=2940301 RepID=A0ABY5BU27_9LACO|nr:hypothetical protein [Fructilactobacillus myrtifloralis]USS85758.1 hypothetical protein M3M35_03780 [Fructilactobacillus myrtifloralis]
MKIRQLRQQNADLQQQLTPANQRYYQSLLLYVRFFSFFIHETEIESQLLAILYHILDGQAQGQSAAKTLGMNPKALAYQITQAQKISTKSLWNLLGVLTVVVIIAICVPVLLIPNLQLNLGSFALAIAYLWLFGWVVTRPRMLKFFLRLPTWGTIILTVVLWVLFFYPLLLLPIISKTTAAPIGASRLVRFLVLALIIVIGLGIYLYRTHTKASQ